MLRWVDRSSFVIEDTRFLLVPKAGAHSTSDRFIVCKPRWMVEEYLRLVPEFTGGNVFELGIYEGGSTAMLAALLRPRRMVAVDLDPEPNAVLSQFLADRALSEAVRAVYGVDQSDRPRLESILEHDFAGEKLDLVVDDASHSLDETTASFAALFPRLRPGGVFVLEDWSWDHTFERAVRARPKLMERLHSAAGRLGTQRRGLSRLLVDAILVAGYAPEVVATVSARRGFAVVRRGDGTVDPETFELEACYGAVGEAVLTDGRTG